MYKRSRSNKYGSPTQPRPRQHDKSPTVIAGTRINKYNKKVYKLTEEHEQIVEREVHKGQDAQELEGKS
jgi:hypothetical protein